MNAYLYCVGDPVNRRDPNGHWSFLEGIRWLSRAAQNLTNRLNPFRRAVISTVQNDVAQLTRAPHPDVGISTMQVTRRTRSPISDLNSTSRSSSQNTPPSNPRQTGSLFRPPNYALTTNDELLSDMTLVFEHAPNNADPNDIMRVLDGMNRVRRGESTVAEEINFFSQFNQD